MNTATFVATAVTKSCNVVIVSSKSQVTRIVTSESVQPEQLRQPGIERKEFWIGFLKMSTLVLAVEGTTAG